MNRVRDPKGRFKTNKDTNPLAAKSTKGERYGYPTLLKGHQQ